MQVNLPVPWMVWDTFWHVLIPSKWVTFDLSVFFDLPSLELTAGLQSMHGRWHIRVWADFQGDLVSVSFSQGVYFAVFFVGET